MYVLEKTRGCLRIIAVTTTKNETYYFLLPYFPWVQVVQTLPTTLRDVSDDVKDILYVTGVKVIT